MTRNPYAGDFGPQGGSGGALRGMGLSIAAIALGALAALAWGGVGVVASFGLGIVEEARLVAAEAMTSAERGHQIASSPAIAASDEALARFRAGYAEAYGAFREAPTGTLQLFKWSEDLSPGEAAVFQSLPADAFGVPCRFDSGTELVLVRFAGLGSPESVSVLLPDGRELTLGSASPGTRDPDARDPDARGPQSENQSENAGTPGREAGDAP